MSDDERFMRRCLELALKGEGRVEPNPMVGAVVVRGGRIVGEGAHRRFGGPHAEVEALRKAGPKAKGATLYVNLEPCGPHAGKKTPPCTDLLVASGVRAVVAAVRDPNPAVDGRGLSLLRKSGVRVRTGVLRREARDLNAAFVKYHTRRLPYVIAKWAMTLDGKIASSTGDSKWISSSRSRSLVKRLRSKVQGIVVGSGTALRDDPRLSASRGAPARIVLDTRARLPVRSQLVRTASEQRLIVAVSASAPEEKLRVLRRHGCEVLALEVLDLRVLFEVLAREGIQKILIEGGSEVHAAAMEAGLVDEVWAFVAPVIAGGREAKTPVAGRGVEKISEALALRDVSVERIGSDVVIRGRVRGNV